MHIDFKLFYYFLKEWIGHKFDNNKELLLLLKDIKIALKI